MSSNRLSKAKSFVLAILTAFFALLASCAETEDGFDTATDPRPDLTAEEARWDISDVFPDDLADVLQDTGCPAGRVNCGGVCVDLNSDHDHCGACNNACEDAEVCSGGECTLECPPDQDVCSGSCVDLQTDIYNCGRCGRICTAGLHAEPLCESGECSYECEAGWIDVDGDGTCETNCTPSAELCNGLDDDCDGECDNGFDCCRGETRSCSTSCSSAGTDSCLAACSWSGCIPPAETCNGLDDDCDDVCDNGFECCLGDTDVACTNPVGVAGSCNCLSGCVCSECCAVVETCGNGYDDDCNGTADDGCSTSGCTSSPDTNWGDGPVGCSAANQRCASGYCITCSSAGGYFLDYCWYEGDWGEDCPSVCSAKGGVAEPNCHWGANWTYCEVCSHFMGDPDCSAADDSGPCYAAHLWNDCWAYFTHDTGRCTEVFDWMKRFCACLR